MTLLIVPRIVIFNSCFLTMLIKNTEKNVIEIDMLMFRGDKLNPSSRPKTIAHLSSPVVRCGRKKRLSEGLQNTYDYFSNASPKAADSVSKIALATAGTKHKVTSFVVSNTPRSQKIGTCS